MNRQDAKAPRDSCAPSRATCPWPLGALGVFFSLPTRKCDRPAPRCRRKMWAASPAEAMIVMGVEGGAYMLTQRIPAKRETRDWPTDSRHWERYKPRAGDIIIGTSA